MDKNNLIGILLIFGIFILWQQLVGPTPEQIAEQERMRDSIALVEQQELNGRIIKKDTTSIAITDPTIINESDSAKQVRFSGNFGPFAQAAAGTESNDVLENDLFKITFSSKGGTIKEVVLKKHFKAYLDENNEEYTVPLKLLEDEKNRFEYFLPIANLPTGGVKTSDLYFTAKKSGDNGITFRADAGNGRFFEQKYSISPDSYVVDYDVNFAGLANVLSNGTETIKLDWVNYLDRLERNTVYEVRYSTVYYKPTSDDVDYCSCTGDDKMDLEEEGRLKWVSHSNQFFNTSLMAKDNFKSATIETELLDEKSEDLKKLRSQILIPIEAGSANPIAMQMYIGPNEFDRLAKFDNELEYIIPFGTSIFGTINRWLIRPLFNFFSGFIGSAGLVILMLTLLIKTVLFPLTYKMIYSQAKMGALKPQMAKVKERFKDDPQKQQMETMKMYREFGVNPLGGCMPMVLQMPIWFALYRFFPASIEFRQASFLWATDLSSYDAFMYLPFDVPFYGAHISLFTILWAITTVMYTYYNTQHMDMGGGQNAVMMKYMQYMMPIMFLFFFNTFAAGLTCYLFFSNVINVSQMIITKEIIIDKKKIAAELERNKAKPKKKSGFGARLEDALKEQQRLAKEREDEKPRRKPRRK